MATLKARVPLRNWENSPAADVVVTTKADVNDDGIVETVVRHFFIEEGESVSPCMTVKVFRPDSAPLTDSRAADGGEPGWTTWMAAPGFFCYVDARHPGKEFVETSPRNGLPEDDLNPCPYDLTVWGWRFSVRKYVQTGTCATTGRFRWTSRSG